MDTKIEINALEYWMKLSADDRTKLLQENGFWVGFSTYLWEYIPEDLKTTIALKSDCNMA